MLMSNELTVRRSQISIGSANSNTNVKAGRSLALAFSTCSILFFCPVTRSELEITIRD